LVFVKTFVRGIATVLLTFHHDRRNAIKAAAMRSTDEAFRPQVAGPKYPDPS